VLLDSIETKERILSEFLKICPFEGWTKAALNLAVRNSNISESFVDLIFENGCLDLAEFYIKSQNEKAAKQIAEIENFHSRKIRDKIRLSLYARIDVEKDHQIVLQRLINFYLDPKNFIHFEVGAKPMIQALKSCYKISDFIWKEINDQSTDFNFYTKRLTLAKIILRTLLVFTKDDSENSLKTKNFIDSQISKVMKFEQRKMQLKKMLNTTFLDENGTPKNPKEIIKNLPFFRLIKFK